MKLTKRLPDCEVYAVLAAPGYYAWRNDISWTLSFSEKADPISDINARHVGYFPTLTSAARAALLVQS